MRGRFITFEGGEGSGKSTHARLLADRLNSLGIEVVLTREPGGSPGAEIIRHVLLSGLAKPLGAETEAILFAAARDDHVRATIRPALTAGKWVVCDRFIDSTRVYQGALGKVDGKPPAGNRLAGGRHRGLPGAAAGQRQQSDEELLRPAAVQPLRQPAMRLRLSGQCNLQDEGRGRPRRPDPLHRLWVLRRRLPIRGALRADNDRSIRLF